jgi:type II restriction/modification system DNA methylase subunit YeeA
MNRTAIKSFAIWARRYLQEQVVVRLDQLGITTKTVGVAKRVEGGLTIAGMVLNEADAQLYEQLMTHLEDLQRQSKTLKKAVEYLIDEIAYTWFNRLAALRFMEVNGYLGQRVLSSSDPSLVDPDLLRDAGSIAELEGLPGLTLAILEEWRSQAQKQPNPEEALYRQLLGLQCRVLAESLPFLFDSALNYLNLFMPANLLNQDSTIRRMVQEIPEEDWRDSSDSENGVEIIGWLYQFYISERKDRVIGAKSKIEAEDIPAATQLFTPHWIVRYMVENSLGRLWLESHPESGLRGVMKYYLESPPPLVSGEKSSNVQSPPVLGDLEGKTGVSLQPQDLTFLDPACGSGHILVYAFDLLFEIYKEQGYREREIPALILTHNLHGLDIDERAVQLASFAVLMKARARNARFFRDPTKIPFLKIVVVKSTRNLKVVRSISSPFSKAVEQLALFPTEKTKQLDLSSAVGEDAGIISFGDLVRSDWEPLLDAFEEADNLGSLISPPAFDRERLLGQVNSLERNYPIFLPIAGMLRGIIEQADLLSKKYWVVVANPPYMGNKGMNNQVKTFLQEKYKDVKSDLFSAFVVRNFELTKPDGLLGFMTPFVWMFLSSYENLREKLVKEKTIINLVKPSYTSFFASAIIPLVTFTLRNKYQDETGIYIDLGYLGSAESQPIKMLEAINNPECSYLYYVKQTNFEKIPGRAIGYWASEHFLDSFQNGIPLHKLATPRAGMITSNNDIFIRLWNEIDYSKIGIDCTDRQQAILSQCKWFPYQKGGEFRKWYGNLEYVVNWQNDGYEIRNKKDKSGKILAHAFNEEYIFKPNVNWTGVTSSCFSVRITSKGMLFDAGGSAAFPNLENLYLLASFLNSKISQSLLLIMNPTLNFQAWNIGNLPVIFPSIENKNNINQIAINSKNISQKDWDNFETSWDFQTHPLLRYNTPFLPQAFSQWQQQSETAFQQLKHLEQENNKYWIEAYGLQDELNPEVPDDQITIRRADLERDIKSLISYAIGCMMGRYSCDRPGLIHAGQPFDPSQHQKYPADNDGILPITDQAYFEDDILNRFIDFLKITYSPETLSENLDFIANALTLRTGETARDRIRRYFVSEFITDHIKTYKKRPIYWLFTSGKKRAFGALVYLHRYDPDTIGRIRTDYILELQTKLDQEITQIEKQAENANTTIAKRTAQKRLKELQEQQLELRNYQAKIQTFGDKRIKLDLDDGVAYNYTRFKDIIYEGSELKIKDLEQKAQWKIDLLKQEKL